MPPFSRGVYNFKAASKAGLIINVNYLVTRHGFWAIGSIRTKLLYRVKYPSTLEVSEQGECGALGCAI